VIGKESAYLAYPAKRVFLARRCADKRMLAEMPTLPELFRVLCPYRGRGTIQANQEPLELAGLRGRLSRKPLKRVAEGATAKGGTLYLWTRAAGPQHLPWG
jgi:hypothetical protein